MKNGKLGVSQALSFVHKQADRLFVVQSRTHCVCSSPNGIQERKAMSDPNSKRARL